LGFGGREFDYKLVHEYYSPFAKGSSGKIGLRGEKASLVDRGRGKFKPPKPGGRCLAGKYFPGFRGAIPATSENLL
jgi:hypothetical protein